MITLFFQPITKEYFAPLLSQSTLLVIIVALFCIIFPILAAYTTESINSNLEFWIRESITYEHPIVSFENQFIAYALDSNDETLLYSSLNISENPNTMPTPLIQTESIDSNKDSVIDKLKIKMTWLKAEFQSVLKNLKLLFLYKYAFNVFILI